MMYTSPDHQKHDFAWRNMTQIEIVVGNALLFPLGKNGSELCLTPQEAKSYIEEIKENILFQRKEYSWHANDEGYDMSDDLSWDWVKCHSKKEI